VTTLVDEIDLVAIAANACLRTGIPGHEQQVAYCLAVLHGKSDPPRASQHGPPARTYKLDVGADDYSQRLGDWADTIAGHMRDSGVMYEAIHDEVDRYEITTLRRLIRSGKGDDIVDALADGLAAVLTSGPRLQDMTRELAREVEPGGNHYVFQSPLSQWVGTIVRRKSPRETDPLEARTEQCSGDRTPGESERVTAERDEVYRTLVARIAALADTRDLLSNTIGRADQIERSAAQIQLASTDEATKLQQIRAELAYVVDELRKEQRGVGPMLAYIVLAMRTADKLQRVTILSLRVASLERAVVDHLAHRMRAAIDDPLQPTPLLIAQTQQAKVPGPRSAALERLRNAPASRAAELRPVVRMLDQLPATVGDVAAIAAALPGKVSKGSVATMRGDAAKELALVDARYEHAFRRYAMATR